ncbi:SH3 domain-containing protein [Oxalobacteraceae bacterium A2-2]
MSIPRLIAGLAMALAAAGSQAFDFKTVGAAPVILYDAPSTKGSKLFVVPRGAPLEVVLTYGEWVKVRDVTGELAWTEAKGLSAKRNVIVRTPNLKIRATPDDNGAIAFAVDKGVLLEAVEAAAGGWVKVRHRDGSAGYVKNADIWGI